MTAAVGLQCGFGAPLGSVLDELRMLGLTIIRLDLQNSTQEDTTTLTQEVLNAGLQPLCIIRRSEQMFAIPEGALIEVGNEPDLEHFGWTVESYIEVANECVKIALEKKRRLYLGVVSNLNRRGFNFLRKLPWDEWVGDGICCSIHRYPDGHFPQNPHQGSKSREDEVATLRKIVGNRPLACTEFGYHGVEWTDAEIADNTVWERNFFSDQGFEIVSAYQLNDGPGTEPIDQFGFRRPDGTWKAVAFAFANTTFPPLTGIVLTLKSDHGKFLSAPQNQIVVADRAKPAEWEQFQVTRLDKTHIALRSWQHQALTAELDLSVNARAENIGPWEVWEFAPQEDGRITLKSDHGQYLTAEQNGSVRARADVAGPWEQWTCEPPNWWVEPGVDNHNRFTGEIRRDGRMVLDDTGPRQVMGCHFMEGFSAFVHGKVVGADLTVREQLKVIAEKYGAVRVLDVLGYYDRNRPGAADEWVAWAGREVTPIPFDQYSGARIEATPNYWEKKREFITMCHELGLKVLDDRGDMNSWTNPQKLEHMRLNGEFYNSLPFGKEVLLGLWSCNEAWQNGGNDKFLLEDMLDAFKAGAGWLPAICGLSAPGGSSDPEALAQTDPLMSEWEPEMPDSFDYWSTSPATCLTIHGNRGNHAHIVEHYFCYAYDEQMRNSGKVAFNTEPVGTGDKVSVGRVNDPELLCALTAAALLGGQAWIYMSGHGVFWDGPIQDQPGFNEVARLTSFLPNDTAKWPLVCHSGTRFAGARILAAVDPTRSDQSVSDDGRFILVVHTQGPANALPCERACSEFTVINMVTGEFERTGPMRVGETFRHGGHARLVVGQLEGRATREVMERWSKVVVPPTSPEVVEKIPHPEPQQDVVAAPTQMSAPAPRRAGRLLRLMRLLGDKGWSS